MWNAGNGRPALSRWHKDSYKALLEDYMRSGLAQLEKADPRNRARLKPQRGL